MANVFCFAHGRDRVTRHYKIDAHGKKQKITAFDYFIAVFGKKSQRGKITERGLEYTYVTILDEEKIEG